MVICKISDVTEYMFSCLYFILLYMKCKEIPLPITNLSDYSMSYRRVFSQLSPTLSGDFYAINFIKTHIYIRYDKLLFVEKY